MVCVCVCVCGGGGRVGSHGLFGFGASSKAPGNEVTFEVHYGIHTLSFQKWQKKKEAPDSAQEDESLDLIRLSLGERIYVKMRNERELRCSSAHVHSRVESRPCGVAQLSERVTSGSFATARGCAAGSKTREAWVSHHFCAGYQKVYVPRMSALKPNGSITNRDRQSTTHKSDESSKTNIGNEKRPTLHYRLVNS